MSTTTSAAAEEESSDSEVELVRPDARKVPMCEIAHLPRKVNAFSTALLAVILFPSVRAPLGAGPTAALLALVPLAFVLADAFSTAGLAVILIPSVRAPLSYSLSFPHCLRSSLCQKRR